MNISDPGADRAPPSWTEDQLAGLPAGELVALLVANDDRVPRHLIDACVARGPRMVAALQERLVPRDDEVESGEWWLKLHAAMILGLMPAEDAGLFLIDLMQRLDEEQDDDMQDWLASCWPALFANKPASLVGKLRDLALDRSMDWYMRSMALDVVIAAGERAGPAALDAELAWVAGTLAGEAGEDFDMRLIAADLLLDHPRAAHRALLEQLAVEQRVRDVYAHFDAEGIDAGYAAGRDTPQWAEFSDPWQFYEPEAIAERQRRWATEDDEDLAGDVQLPYLRESPRIGRNDPCPCGSGKKYKKCCLALQG